jgi:hypothetical protein
MKTYLNKNKIPIIRKCDNCSHYTPIDGSDKVGYCKANNLMFAFTHDKSVYFIVKDFYLCESHNFKNEDLLKLESEEVDLLPYLLERNKSKKNS